MKLNFGAMGALGAALLACATPGLALSAWSGDPADFGHSKIKGVTGTRGMVVSDDEQASEWGVEILRQGGNAVDAAVATGFMLSVTRPHYASLGGGGFMVYCPAPGSKGPSPCAVMDYRERAPQASKRDMYLKDGKADLTLSQDGALASGVPGVVAGLLEAQEKYGHLKRAKLLTKPIAVAKSGIRMTGLMESFAQDRWKVMNAGAKKILGCQGHPCPAGKLLKQEDLAHTLEAVSARGKNGFYQGEVAGKLVQGLKAAGGILTLEDLAQYRPILREPVSGKYKDFEIVTMPPPSAGGAVILQLFRFAQKADEDGAFGKGFLSAPMIHALAHGMVLGFADRARHFGDPGYVDVPVQKLTDFKYLDQRWKSYRSGSANSDVEPGVVDGSKEGDHTTHFSVIDGAGNAVAVTTTINSDFGSGFVPHGTGVFMNNEMDDFSVAPGVANQFGLVGDEANAIMPGKTPLSSMSPTIVRDSEGNNRIVIGAAGGPRITTSVFLTLLYRLRFDLSLPEAVAAPRFHEQWKPFELRVETNGFSPEVLARLKDLGYPLKETRSLAQVHALERFKNGRVWGAPDPRGEGGLAAAE